VIQFGTKQSFAICLSPLPGGPPDSDPAVGPTWVSLELWVGGRNLTLHTHEEDQRVDSGLHWPAIYLARWFVRAWQGFFENARWPIAAPERVRTARDLVAHWDRRIAESEPPDAELDQRDRFVSTHFLEAGAGGGLVPSVCFARGHNTISITWESAGSTPPGVAFHRGEGHADVDVGQFAEVVRGFVDWVRDRAPAESADARELGAWLDDFGSQDAASRMMWSFAGIDEGLRRLWQKRFGLARFFRVASEWVRDGALARPEQSVIAVAFRSASPRLSPDELLLLRQTILGLERGEQAHQGLESLGRRLPIPHARQADYEQGYDLAAALRSELRNRADYLDVEQLVRSLGVPIAEVELSDPDLDGAAVCDAEHGPAILVNRRSPKASVPWGRRMVLAHELGHLVFDRDAAVPLAVVSGPWAPARVERRANAFAAELLLPRVALERLAAARGNDDELIERAMKEYGVGWRTASWQIENRLA
jgi:hypothetical protein